MKLEVLCGKTGYVETEYALLPFYYLSEREIVLFDSGADEDEALLQLLEQEGLHVRAVVCTHLHPDHVANNKLLIEHHGAEIFGHHQEFSYFHEHYGNPFPVTPIEDGDTMWLEGVPFRTLHTPGHSPGHLVLITPDKVCCVGDAVITLDELERSKLPYMDDVDRAIISMEDLRQTQFPLYILAHKGVVTRAELDGIIDRNIEKELDLYELLRKTIHGPTPLEQVVTDYIRATGVRSDRMVEKDFVRHTARVRILALVSVGEFSIEDGMVIPRF